MRLKHEEISLFKLAVSELLKSAELYLFGSRVDDSARGGDIDILIRAERKLTLIEKARIRSAYYRRFGERKIDLVTVKVGEEDRFVQLILESAIAL